jgi:hypothetical protein
MVEMDGRRKWRNVDNEVGRKKYKRLKNKLTRTIKEAKKGIS